MGGTNSGRRRTTNLGTVEQFPRLDIRSLRCHSWLIDGLRLSNELSWTKRGSAALCASAWLIADLRYPFDRHAVVEYNFGDTSHRQHISILARPMPFGGLRFFFLCPILHIPCEVLPYGVHGFASRQANRLTYRTQSETKLGRAVSARMKVEEKLWPTRDPKSAARGANKERLLRRQFDLQWYIDGVIDAKLQKYE